MTAHTRSRPRASRSPRTRRQRGRWNVSRVLRPEFIGLAIAALTIAAIPFLVDVPAVAAEARDWLTRTFGLGIFILASLSVLGGLAISRRSYTDWKRFARQASGAVCLGLFIWGALGLNKAEWTLGGVDFRQVTLGGDIGRYMVAGWLGKLAWMSTLVLAAALLAPGATRAFARNAPGWVETAWERRWPHRVAGAVGRFFAFVFRRPGGGGAHEPEIVIGGTLRERLQPRPVPAFEENPVQIRPSIDPGGPMSAIGTGAAAHFRPQTVVSPVDADEDEPLAELEAGDEDAPDDPQQLSLGLGQKPGWQLPALELLNAPQISTNRKHDNAARAQLIVDTLASFGVDATVVEINEGPTVTQFGVEPGWEVRYKDMSLKDEQGKLQLGPDGRTRTERVEVGRTRVRVNKITALQNDLALALAAPSLRIEAPVPGRAIVGIEVPNDSATVVTLRNVMEAKEFRDLAKKTKLALALGKGVSGVPIVADLAKMPHLLIAGATGSGKSVCMNAIIAGIMMEASPADVRFVMVDPKRVELTAYKGIPHLAFSEVIVDVDKVVGALQAVVAEMEARYKKFAAVSVRNIETYNRHPRVLNKLPYWVVIIDELADLMMAAPFEVEKLLCRLAQLARATGIHLVVATQRPSVDVVTGLIKANFPTRIAFAVTSMTDSRTILDMGGAEKLLGRGDMLYMPTDAAKPIRLQGVYVSDAEVERIVQFWTDDRFRNLTPETADNLLEEALTEMNGDGDFAVEESDPIVERARGLALQHRHVSPSLFQRRLHVGYVKATKLIDILEEEGIVGPREEGESRKVIASATDDGLY
ncbi:DNA translocase FtsK [bacterium]|nr:MAG: DNA translocase FtsK [bacterium]RIL01551.1 MAG: DNA translocase FtsK [bacterium]